MDIARDIAEKSVESLRVQTQKKMEEEPATANMYKEMILDNKYLNSNVEAFARAFESYVSDKLEDNGRKNTYLSSKAKTIGKDGIMIYPQAEYRKQINEMFDKFFDMIRGSEDLKKAIANFNNKLIFRKIYNPETGHYEYRRLK
jgi:hypothetical protein